MARKDRRSKNLGRRVGLTSGLISGLTFASISISAVLSAAWFLASAGIDQFEPAVGVFGLLAGLTGVLAERRAVARERRHTTLNALGEELRATVDLLSGGRFAPNTDDVFWKSVFPRLPISATDAALTSGTLALPSDTELVGRLHIWRDLVNGLNRRLELTELHMFLVDRDQDTRQIQEAMSHPDSYLMVVRDRAAELAAFLKDRHTIH